MVNIIKQNNDCGAMDDHGDESRVGLRGGHRNGNWDEIMMRIGMVKRMGVEMRKRNPITNSKDIGKIMFFGYDVTYLCIPNFIILFRAVLVKSPESLSSIIESKFSIAEKY